MNNYIVFWRLQKEAKLNNSQAAEFLGVGMTTIKRFRNGSVRVPRAVILTLMYKIEHGDPSFKLIEERIEATT